mmetsp:Transcript_11486/g.28932  ORF Transcript_11486/g.28932 Transcript_11486/m.28932 type:complete len:451 (-) Transcript_11486:113-1465(-)|eukprot:CAMPEP_0177648568 /NCGR_PEP_ID=MMETSP0447-20121125/10897_1 /TAXON_ID=0 /ORGANISM="Stygamoeba regulata, Strain BSH-02190019" /LENGTH=450 /DNA_ID=CAMNT_0019151217 /DNA_START=63 /DNA_END=1415 /DNA_ORIENTATION=+
MDDEYDIIVLGTGFTECVLSGFFSVEGKRVLHMDRNSYYGAESASLHLGELFAFKKKEPDESIFGKIRTWNVDMIPKFIMADGRLVKMLIKTDTKRYMDFAQIKAAFVFKNERSGRVHRVPCTPEETLKSPLLGLFEKRRCHKFVSFVVAFNPQEPSTFKHFPNILNKERPTTMAEVYKYFGLEESTQEFLGHAVALHTTDEYLGQPAVNTIEKMKLYWHSLSKFGKSPFIYPLYGLGELPQAFARLAAVCGGTYMLNTPIEEIVYDDEGKFVGVKSKGQVAKAKMVIADPSYFPDKVKKVGQILRYIALIDHPVEYTDKLDSCQVIFPRHQLNRKHDVHLTVLGAPHQVAPQGKYIAIISTVVETSKPKQEIAVPLKYVGAVLEEFWFLKNVYEPLPGTDSSNVFISRSYDETSHFETASADIMDLYERITGHPLDLTPPAKDPSAEAQ